ncbi:MAG: hypothetical protein A2731_00335 [Candidatus Buchananbacteria bacterium RIFCSPHIGHO2_01_FULL_39_8]|uniref:Phosphatidate cytidylyltransferase n=1 Tax=Candidatus Buchananbacteria bacterium RIFCSPHIGHO2_01_FULL_39_8 TaxID=1797533 RepID=A0A1G1XUW5_9BACT|nr:MAG: hypothetical protein A2731_00335 [Candidatus Buchananbacteria bacterium RIFCSPHIGHO2_01_FULL_39_8]
MIYLVRPKISNETKRQGVHIVLFILAFLLRYVSRWQMVFLLFLLLVFTLFFVPRLKLKSHLYRQFEQHYSRGAISYFFSLIIIVLIFPLPVVAAAWVILALGDGMATLIGRSLKVKELPWNREKSYAGTVAFIIFGVIGSVIMLHWMLPDLSSSSIFFLSLKTVIVAAIIESLPWRINDNISVPLASAVVMYLLMIG